MAIDADGATQAVLLRNNAHLTLDHLDLTAPGDGRTLRRGVYGLLPEVTLQELDIHDVKGCMPATLNPSDSSRAP
ncbi:hypothetical protein [Tessaracoccus flavescens]|uniref:Uncharacterized protein n=1 Tax=Tessaracoccus flavescens TaxID=399497 RepID=A0A1Q2CY93_9ACTN|nr:hypothetical protein [Tessaracoccus flavescens]AQP51001.1 hypothetical protein BW733_09340 [Tessaracoccus flavescens]